MFVAHNQLLAERYAGNPILRPIPDHPWEAAHVLNPTAFELDGVIQILYRAVGHDNTSVIGLATSRDGFHIDERLPAPIYCPRADFELKAAGPTDNSGCEDARAVILNDRLYITYTAYDSLHPPQVAVSSISLSDFQKRDWSAWELPELLSPIGIDDKDACILPQPIDGKYLVFHRVDGHVCGDYVPDLDFAKHKLKRCTKLFEPRPGSWDSLKVGIAGPPIKTADGWILFYHGVGDDGYYRLGAVLLDANDPTIVMGRSDQPILEPTKPWEVSGWIPHVIFPCGQIVRDGIVYIYYGGADHVVAVATIKQQDLLDALVPPVTLSSPLAPESSRQMPFLPIGPHAAQLHASISLPAQNHELWQT